MSRFLAYPALDNAVAAKYNTARSIQDAGDVWGDCFEVSRLRPDDFAFIAPKVRAAAHPPSLSPFCLETVMTPVLTHTLGFAMSWPQTPEYDVLQCNTAPSSRTMRGHQFPMAFLTMASGLDAHGTGSKLPLAYTHLDIAGRCVLAWLPHVTVGGLCAVHYAFYAPFKRLLESARIFAFVRSQRCGRPSGHWQGDWLGSDGFVRSLPASAEVNYVEYSILNRHGIFCPPRGSR